MSAQTVVPDKLRALLALANNGAPQTTDPTLTRTIAPIPIPAMPSQPMQRLAVPSAPDSSQLTPLPVPQTSGPTLTQAIPQTPLTTMPPPSAQDNATQLRTLGDQSEYQRLINSGSGVQQVTRQVDPQTGMPTGQKPSLLRRFGGVLARIGDTAESIVAPGVAALTPGTTLHHDLLLNQQAGRVNNDLGDERTQSENALRDAQAGYYQQHAGAVGLRPITPEEADAIGNPTLAGTMAAPVSIAHMLTTAATNKTRETVASTNADARTSAAQIAADAKTNIASLKPEQRDDRAIRILATPDAQRTPDDIAYLRGYNQWVEQTKVAPGVARAQAYAQWKPVQVVDLATGNTYYASAANAIGTHAPGTSSIPFRTASAMARYMTSGKGGATMTAYRTATDHLDLLSKAASALQNGDIPAFNRVGNTLAQETGRPAPTNFEAIKSMLSGELANVAKASGATDSEITNMRSEISSAASPGQLQGIITINQDLMDQKAKEMFEQYQAGIQGQPVTTRGGINPSTRTPLAPHGGGTAPPRPANVPDGYVFNANGPKGRGWYKP